MLSAASKHTPRRYQRLRKYVGILPTSSVRQQQWARFTSTIASSTSKQQHPLVISRRAWLAFKESRGITKKRPNTSKGSKSDDEKPWPRNVQIAGYLAAAVAVPYVILWTVTSNPILRDWFGPYIPLDKLRTHYGKLEWDAQSYSEEMEDLKKGKGSDGELQLLVDYYQFPEEAPYDERRQQKLIETMDESNVEATISLSSSSEEIVTKTIAANTIASAENLLEYFPSNVNSKDDNTTVAVDFLDRNNLKNDVNNLSETSNTGVRDLPVDSLHDGFLTSNDESIANPKLEHGEGGTKKLSIGSRQLIKDIQTISKWGYIPQITNDSSKKGANDTSTKTPHLTEMEIEIGRLEYEISELEKNLRDPMCTRSIDDMTTELRQAKRELSKLSWKRRLGFSR